MRRFLWVAVPWVLACGGAGMGEPCEETVDCEEGGSCLAGVCSGYACEGDGDCENGYTCGSVAGTPVCVVACEGDDDCGGEQTCREVAVDEEGEEVATVCL